MREEQLLQHIAARSRGIEGVTPSGIEIAAGPGDDCAVLRVPGPANLLATVDHLIEGRHFEPATPIDLIARKAVARSLSDIAAMGGVPVAGLATACLPFDYPHSDELFDAMARWGRHWQCPLIGGDVARAASPLVLTVTVLGAAARARGPVMRSGAVAGDGVYVTGAIGNSLRSGRHLRFEPRVDAGSALAQALGDDLHAMIDVSDGLGRDAGRVARASGVRIQIELSRVPLHPDVTDRARALSDGEDYELLFTADDRAVERAGLLRRGAAGVPVARIGAVTAGTGCAALDERGSLIDASQSGWDHGA